MSPHRSLTFVTALLCKVYEAGPTLTIDLAELKELDGTVASLKQVCHALILVVKPISHLLPAKCCLCVQLIVRVASAQIHPVLSHWLEHFYVGCRNVPGGVGKNICRLLLNDRSLVNADCKSFFVLPGSSSLRNDVLPRFCRTLCRWIWFSRSLRLTSTVNVTCIVVSFMCNGQAHETSY